MKLTEPLEAGRELDALVAEKVMGWVKVRNGNWLTPEQCQGYGVDFNGMSVRNPKDLLEPMPNYSTDMAAAWLVVEKLHQDGALVNIENDAHLDGRTIWRVRIDVHEEEAETSPFAICLAALRAAQYTPNATQGTPGASTMLPKPQPPLPVQVTKGGVCTPVRSDGGDEPFEG